MDINNDHYNNQNTNNISNNNDNNKMLLSGFNLDSKGLKQLLDSQSLVDCTLACDGGKISAHKIVLSACSSYLAKILLEHPVEHPIIILPELSIDDVRTLVHYMYTGELLKMDTLNSASLLRTAAILSVNSLNDLLLADRHLHLQQQQQFFVQQQQQLIILQQQQQQLQQQKSPTEEVHATNSSQSTNNNNIPSPDTASSRPPLQPTTFTITASAYRQAQFHDQVAASQNSNHSLDSSLNDSMIGNNNSSITTNNGPNNSLNDSNSTNASTISSITSNNYGNSYGLNKTSEFQFKCPVCQNDFQTICSFEYHMQRIHSVTSFGCEICHKPFASLRYVLTDHMRRCHGWKAADNQKLQSCQ